MHFFGRVGGLDGLVDPPLGRVDLFQRPLQDGVHLDVAVAVLPPPVGVLLAVVAVVAVVVVVVEVVVRRVLWVLLLLNVSPGWLFSDVMRFRGSNAGSLVNTSRASRQRKPGGHATSYR